MTDALSAVSRRQLGARWAYRAGLELSAAHRFRQLAERFAAAGVDREILEVARVAGEQEIAHVELCARFAERFGGSFAPTAELADVIDVAPPDWDATTRARDRLLYEVVAFCCVCETANAAVVTANLDDVDDAEIRRGVRTILADEVQHSRLGWRYLSTYAPDDAQRAWLGQHLPDMLEGTIRADLFRPQVIVGDELTMQRFGTLPVAGRRAAFLGGMREVLLPGLAGFGVDVAPAAAWLDALERQVAWRAPA